MNEETIKQLQELADAIRRIRENKDFINWRYLLKHRCTNYIIKEIEQ